jgi:hypothetical protein
MRLRRRPELRIAALVLIVAAAVAASVSGRERVTPNPGPGTWRGLVGDAHPAVSMGNRMIVVLRTPSVAARLARVHYATEQDERSWAAQAYAAQSQVLTMLATHGLGGRPDYSFARVLNGFSASLDPRAVALLEKDPEVAGVFPVRAAFPATLSAAAVDRRALLAGKTKGAGIALPGFDGDGVTIALLDTGVDRSQPFLHGHVDKGLDVLGANETADAQPNPQEPGERERHGTELAGLIVGARGPAGLHGVAPAARLLPIRVAGWQPDARGRDVVYARSDQLIAGLDRAVDPNGDGDTHDAARVALIGVAEPFAAFADSPEALAVAGALALDTLVVAPAGNDGAAGPLYGSLSGPGGAPAALTVGATDPRATTTAVRVVLWHGLDVLFDRRLPLLDVLGPNRPIDLGLGMPVGSGTSVRDYFDRSGLSLVGAKAALVPAGSDPAAAAVAAARAGAKAVLFYGAGLPAGSLGLSGELGIPVVAVPSATARRVLIAARRGEAVGVALGRARAGPNEASGHVATFSSRGLAYSGLPKPDLSAPGIGLATSEPATSADGEPAFASVVGTSAAAATVAGAAALLAQERPDLTAPDLASLLAGFAHANGARVAASGNGSVDVGSSAVGEVAASKLSLGFGRWQGSHWRGTRTFTLHNVSSRRLVINLKALAAGDSAGLGFLIRPDHLVLRAGKVRQVRVTAKASEQARSPVETGVIVVAPLGGRALRLPWAIGFERPPGTLLPAASLDARSFKPSDVSPATLHVRVGRVDVGRGLQIRPVSRLDVLLYTAGGNFIGLLARVRDLLPGSYSFAVTGRSPGGYRLPPGAYELRLVARPTASGAPSRATVRFRIE